MLKYMKRNMLKSLMDKKPEHTDRNMDEHKELIMVTQR